MAFPTSWGRRCALVIQAGQVTDNEVNFPLLVTEDTLPSEIFDADGSYPALNGGGDIRFSSDEAGNTQLACEIESFITDNDPANGKAAIWVKVPSLSSSTNTTIYIWYNKTGESQPAEDSAYGKENVWDSNFVMVQHMNQIPDGTAGEIVDSTSNDNDGTTSGMDSADQVAGQIDGSLDFDGGDDCVQVSDSTSLNITNAITIEGWIDRSVQDVYHRLFSKGSDGTPKSRYDIYIGGANAINNDLTFDFYSGGVLQIIYGPDVLTGMTHIAITYDQTNIIFYVNNVATSIEQSGAIDSTTGNNLYIGTYLDGTTHPFNGLTDEVRISNVARSAGWIATEYNNQNAPWTFLIEGTPQSPGVGVPIAVFMHHYNQMRAA